MTTISTPTTPTTPTTTPVTAVAWKNRFETPTADDLVSQIAQVHFELLATLRTGLLASPAPREKVQWHGVPWRWTFEYRQRGAQDPVVFLVPEPGRPRLCLPMTAEFICSLSLGTIPRYLRDGILSGTQVGDLLWAEWEPNAKSHVQELLWLIDQRTAISNTPNLPTQD